MSIEIRQLSIKSNVIQRAGDEGAGETRAVGGTQLDEETRNDILAECRAMMLDLMSRSRER